MNFSIGIELVPFKTDFKNNKTVYLNDTETIAKYTSISQMSFKQTGFDEMELLDA